MPSELRPSASRDFVSVACELRLLTPAAAREVADEATSRNISVSQVVLQKGLLSGIQIDIVDTLTRPRDIVPGYEILQPIGQGGMGVVYRARQIALDRAVALKTVLVSQMADRSILSRFEQEAVTVAKLLHPNIVGAYDFGRHAGRLFFVMELVDGETAGLLIERLGQLTEALAWGLARQTAAGLAHAAKAGVVHRDIKPDNLLLVSPPEGSPLPAGMPMVKIADFGLAFLTAEVESRTRLTSTNAAVGSPYYMAPEQLNSDAVDFRADVYSLGATVYHMLAGVPPFAGKSINQIIAAKMSSDPPAVQSANPQISGATADLVQRMMDRDSTRRAASYHELIGEIDRVLKSCEHAAAGEATIALFQNQTQGRPTIVGNAQELAPTTKLAAIQTAQIVTARGSRRRVVLVAAAIAVVAVVTVVVAAIMSRPVAYLPGARDLSASGRSEQLYNGETLRGWPLTPIEGQWSTTLDRNGSQALTGTNGIHHRSLPDWPHYRLDILVWLDDARAAEVHFGILKNNEQERRRLVVRMTHADIQLGTRASDTGPFEPRGPLREDLAIIQDDYSTIHIEKQSTDWFIFLGNDLVGAIPVADEDYAQEFRITAEGGTAWFHQIEAFELLTTHE